MFNLLNYKIANLEKEFNTNSKLGFSKNTRESIKLEFHNVKSHLGNYSPLEIFLSQFNIFVFLLIFSAFFSLYHGEMLDFYILLSFVVIDILLGFFQELKSEKTISLLQKYNQYTTTVLIDGVRKELPHEYLIPGDIIELKSGDLVPADAKVVSSSDFFIDESALTGDSTEVFKSKSSDSKSEDIIFAGTSVIRGYATALVVYTGKNTRIGHLSMMSGKLNGKSIFEIETKKLSNLILKIVSISLTIAVILNFFLRFESLSMFVIYAISLAVTVIPEALPLIVTFSLSNGALNLYKSKVLVKRLSSIEDMGGIEVLCTDKTGTLTENKLKVIDFIQFGNFKLEKIALYSISKIAKLDSFDIALKERFHSEEKFEIIKEVPFDPVKKTSEVIVKVREEIFLIIKGAHEVLHSLDHLSSEEKLQIEEFNKNECKKGNRVLFFGYKKLSSVEKLSYDLKDLYLAGAISFEDKIKFSTYESIKKAKELNIDIRVLTGDSKITSFYVAEKLGLVTSESEVVIGEDLDKLKGEKLVNVVMNSKVFARVTPEHKIKIIKILQSRFLVGYLGEGVNDAPALKLANVGIAVANSSDISKSVADVILTKKSLETLIDGIIEGRKIFQNINKYIKITISANFGNFFALLISSFFVKFLPLLPIQILLIHVLTDIPLMSVSSDNVDNEDLAQPSKTNFTELLKFTIVLGFISSIFDFTIFGYFSQFGQGVLHPAWFLASILTEILIIYSLRTNKVFFKAKKPSFPLILSSIIVIFLSYMLLFSPFFSGTFNLPNLPTNYHLIVISICIVYFIISEITKLAFNKLTKKSYN